MDRERVESWLEGYRRAWEQADTPAVLGLFTEDASYRSHPLRPAHAGHHGIAGYWNQVTADQQEVRVRFGGPIVDGRRVAVEWWTLMRAGGSPTTLVGCLVLAFAGDGRCRDLRECWNLTEGLVDPPAGWGDPHPGRDGVLAYTRRAYATEADQEPHFGTPLAAGSAAAVEWWTTVLEEGDPATLIGTSILTFTPEGLVDTGRDYWFLEAGTHLPYEGWGS
jgi:SnoaL-like domain